MRNKSKLAACLLVPTLALSSCRDSTGYYGKEGKVEGYSVVVFLDGGGRHITLKVDEKNKGYIYAEDTENDGRFDNIKLRNIPKGSPIEKYANLDELERAYIEVMNQ